MTTTTWVFAALNVYIYVGYGLLLYIIAQFVKRPLKKEPIEPSISLIIAAFNEETVIREKLRNVLELDYPADKLEVIVVADGSDDRTAQIASSFADRGVKMLYNAERQGKSHALNRGVRRATGDILVFSDANAYYVKGALRKLVRNFADPAVGVVSGSKTVAGDDLDASQVALSENTYWKYETSLKKLESSIHSSVGVVGEMLAMRRNQYRPIPADIINDDAYLAFQSMRDGLRVIYEPEAISYERPSMTTQDDVLRRQRMNAGRYQLLFRPKAVWPLTSPLALFMIFSHKFMRLLLPFFMLACLLFNGLAVFYGNGGVALKLLLAGQVTVYSVAMLGIVGLENKATRIASYIVVSNAAAVGGLVSYLRGRQTVLWEKAQRA